MGVRVGGGKVGGEAVMGGKGVVVDHWGETGKYGHGVVC